MSGSKRSLPGDLLIVVGAVVMACAFMFPQGVVDAARALLPGAYGRSGLARGLALAGLCLGPALIVLGFVQNRRRKRAREAAPPPGA